MWYRHAPARAAARRAILLALACCTGIAGAAPAGPITPPKGGPAMTPEMRTNVEALLTLADDAYFTLDANTTAGLTRQLAQLIQPPPMSRPPGHAAEPLPEIRVFTAPARIDPKARAAFPLLIAEVRGNLREWQVAARQNGHVIVSNLSTGDVLAAGARDRGRRMPAPEPSGSGTPPDEFNARLSTISVVHRDLMAWVPSAPDRARMHGRLAVTLLDYDLRSNTRFVDAGEPPDSQTLPARPRIVLDPDPASARIDRDGVTLDGSFVPVSTMGRLSARFRLPRNRLTLLRFAKAAAHPALVAASVVLVQLDGEAPVVVDLAVGSETTGGGEGVLQSAFTLDLNGRVAAGDYQAYLAIGETVAGPVRIRVATVR